MGRHPGILIVLPVGLIKSLNIDEPAVALSVHGVGAFGVLEIDPLAIVRSLAMLRSVCLTKEGHAGYPKCRVRCDILIHFFTSYPTRKAIHYELGLSFGNDFIAAKPVAVVLAIDGKQSGTVAAPNIFIERIGLFTLPAL